MNTGDWGVFKAMDQHTSDVLLALSDTGKQSLGKEKEEREVSMGVGVGGGNDRDREQSDKGKYQERNKRGSKGLNILDKI